MLVGTGGILAGNQEAINNIDTGVVNIEIDEYMLKDGKEVPWENGQKIMPCMTVSKIPYFTSTGLDCYIRAFVEIEEGMDTGSLPLTEDSLKGISKDWVKVGDYFYYKKQLKTNDKVGFFREVQIPNWKDDLNVGSWDVDITIRVDAIQAANFTPDFNSKTPWGDVVVSESIHKDGYDINRFTAGSNKSLAVAVVDKDNIIVKSKDFFEGFRTMVPGTEVVDSATVDVNHGGEVFFFAEPLEDPELLEKLKFTFSITKNGKTKVLFEGTLKDTIKKLSLGKFSSGETAKLTFTVSMPADLGNEFTLRKGSVKWVFDLDESDSNVIDTGIDSNIFLYGSLILICAVVAVFLASLVLRRKG